IPDIDSAIPRPCTSGYAGYHDSSVGRGGAETEARHLLPFVVVYQFVAYGVEVMVIIQRAHCMGSIEDVGYRGARHLLDQRLELGDFKAPLLLDVKLLI